MFFILCVTTYYRLKGSSLTYNSNILRFIRAWNTLSSIPFTWVCDCWNWECPKTPKSVFPHCLVMMLFDHKSRLFTIYIKNPSGFKLYKWNAKISIGKSRSEHTLSISRKIGKNRKYIVKGLELDGKPSTMWMERNKPVEKSQPVQEDNLFKHTGFSGHFPIGSTKNMCSIYFLSGITGIFMSMVNNPTV